MSESVCVRACMHAGVSVDVCVCVCEDAIPENMHNIVMQECIRNSGRLLTHQLQTISLPSSLSKVQELSCTMEISR